MRKTALLIPVLFVFACGQPSSTAQTSSDLTSVDDSLAYGIGLSIGNNLKNGNLGRLDPNRIAQGIRDVLDSNETLLSEEQVETMMRAEQMKEQQRQEEIASAEADIFKKIGDEWLAENSKKEGVVVTSTGLQYKILQAGDGSIPSLESQVKVHYTGTLIDGTKFDSSVDRGEPAIFGVGQVIPGWTEALSMMPTGSKWQLFIPADLAYGTRVAPGGKIPPNSALIFDVELIEIVE